MSRRAPSASWASAPWIPATCRSETSATRPASGNVLAEEAQRPRLDVDPGRRERDLVGVAHTRVRDLAVDRLALLVEPAEELSVLRQRPVAVLDAPPRLLDLDVHEHRQRAVPQRLPHALRQDGAAAEREHRGDGIRERLDR